MEIAKLVVESIIGLLGLYLVHSFRRQQRLKIADLRIPVYQKLWELMEFAAPSRVESASGRGPLTPREAGELCRRMRAWYWESGNGMFMTEATQKVWAAALARLDRYAGDRDVDWTEQGWRRIVELSLLRTQMKRDLSVYGVAVDFGLQVTTGRLERGENEREAQERSFRVDFVREKNLARFLRVPLYRRVAQRLRDRA